MVGRRPSSFPGSASGNALFGGEEEKDIQGNSPEDRRTSETALVFLQLIMRKLRKLRPVAAVYDRRSNEGEEMRRSNEGEEVRRSNEGEEVRRSNEGEEVRRSNEGEEMRRS